MFVNFNILNQLGSPAINSNTFANRPAAGQTGRLFVSTDTYEIYRDNGTTWDLIGGPGSSTITGTGTATQVAYFTSSQAIGSSANLFWDNTNGFLGVGTAAPTTRIEAVKTDGVGIYANFTTNAGSGSSTTALWAKNVTNSSGFAAVIEETTPNTTAGQYPLLIKHSLSSGTAGVGMGTGIHWQLPDDAGTFKTTQLTIETINAAAATYATRYRFNVQNNGSSTPVAYINATGLGIFTATPSAALDIHSTGIMAQLNSTSATANSLLAFQRSGSGLWRIGDAYNGGNNYFELHNTVLTNNAIEINAATNKSIFTALQTYTTGLARGNYFDYNLSVAAGGSFSSPNAITALTATLDLTLAGNATIPSGARSGLDAYNSITFTGAGTLTHNQGAQIRAYSNVTAGWAFNGSATGTITHLAGLRALFPDNSGSAVNVTNNYALLLNDQTANTGTVTYTNRWGVYQEGASDLNYFAGNSLYGTTTNVGAKIAISGYMYISNRPLAQIVFNSTGSYYGQLQNDTGDKWSFADNLSNNGTLGTSIMTWVAGTRNIGINQTSPIGKLHVQGVNSGQSIRTDHTSNYSFFFSTISNASPIAFDNLGGQLAIYTASTERIRVTTGGLVGIGTSTPSGLLQLNGVLATPSDAANLTIKQSGTTYTDGIYLERTGERNGYYMYIGGSTDSLNFRRNYFGIQSDVMSLTRDGLVGIGTGTPSFKLQVDHSTTSQYVASFRNTFDNLSINIGTITGGLLNIQGKIISSGVAYALPLQAEGGNVLIGTTTDNGRRLNVSGDIQASIDLYLSRTGVSPAIVLNQPQIRLVDQNAGIQNTIDVISGAIQFSNGIKTAAPTTGTAAIWKLGSRVAATVVVNTTEYIEIDIGGTLYKLATVT